jgi:hypothetical protein
MMLYEYRSDTLEGNNVRGLQKLEVINRILAGSVDDF